jgi:uncharacterized protein involved in type VI secretion and phage assembly
VKAKVPDVLGDVETGWAMPCTPYAGANTGLYMIPPVKAAVWVEFEGGDVSRPIWSGGWWGPNEAPGVPSSSTAAPGRREIRSEKGLTVSLDDDAGELLISDGNGKNLMRIKAQGGQIEITAATRVTIEAPGIRHGKNASEPAVLGRQLTTYLSQLVSLFNAHVHPGQLAAGILPVTPAPPTGPFTAPTPSMLSKKNSVE